MLPPRPKLTRRKGACKLCRKRRIRCNGAKPCSQCERSSCPCEYVDTDHAQRRQQRGLAQNWQQDSLTGEMTPILSSQNDSPEVIVNQVKNLSANAIATTLDPCLLQPTPEATPPFFDSYNYDTTMLEENLPVGIEQDYHFVAQLEGTRYPEAEDDPSILNFLKESCNPNLLRDSAIRCNNFVNIQPEHHFSALLMDILSARITQEKPEPFTWPKAHRINTFFREAKAASLPQQTVLNKIKSVLSQEHQLCLPSLLHQAEHDRWSHNIDLYQIPMKRLIKSAFQEPFGLAMFSREEDVLLVQERFVQWERPPIDISELSMLIVSLTWGALVDPQGELSTLVALVDTIPALSKRLLQQNDSIQKFLALIAIICLTEKMGSHDLSALIFDATLVASALGIHSENVLHYSCVSSKQTQIKQAMWVLYCIDKASALRWQTFPILREDSLPVATLPKDEFPNDHSHLPQSGWLRIRIQYSRISLKVIQLWQSVKQPLSKDLSPMLVKLSMALSVWYESVKTDPCIRSLDAAAAARFRYQVFCSYQEALIQLGIISLSCFSSSSASASCQGYQDLSKRSIREVILFSSTVSFGDLLQNCHLIRLNVLAVCILSLFVTTAIEKNYDPLDQALLSIVCGFLARIQLILPRSPIFVEVSGLVNSLLQ